MENIKVIVDNKGFITNPENVTEQGVYKTKHNDILIKIGDRVNGYPKTKLGVFIYSKDETPEIIGEVSLEFIDSETKEVLFCKGDSFIPVEVKFNSGLYRVVSDNYFLEPVYNFSYKKDGYLVEIPTEKYVKLNDGKYLINDYGKYQSGLSFISNIPLIQWVKKTPQNFNLPEGNFEVIYGNFFTSKKGTKCFEVKDEKYAKHVLISDDWGGAFNSYRGRTLPENGLYYKRARSNGGGVGVDYAIFDKHWKNSLSIEDI